MILAALASLPLVVVSVLLAFRVSALRAALLGMLTGVGGGTLRDLLIGVTNFFRDPEAWQVLESDVIPNLFAGKKGGDTVRVWSCGCASASTTASSTRWKRWARSSA